MQFEAFRLATRERAFDDTAAGLAECYRLCVRHDRGANHRVVRMQRASRDRADGSESVAHFLESGEGDAASASTHHIPLEPRHWCALEALLEVARFWELPERSGRIGLDGATYLIEASRDGLRHRVELWSPDPAVSGGELVCVVTDYLERLGALASYRCELHQRYR